MESVYSVSGMTCGACVATVRNALVAHSAARGVSVTLVPPEAIIASATPIPVGELNAMLRGSHYALVEGAASRAPLSGKVVPKGWFATYYPLLLILLYITGVSVLTSIRHWEIQLEDTMRHFMAGFFLVFSFFKFLDLRGFAESYAGYDLLAMRVKAYGFTYPFIELALGLAYLFRGLDHSMVNIVSIVVMGFSTLGVLRAVLNKQRIQCACLGTVFNLPMSTVTIVEDLLMVAMAAAMLMV